MVNGGDLTRMLHSTCGKSCGDAASNERPPEQADPPRHEETGRVQGASIEQHPRRHRTPSAEMVRRRGCKRRQRHRQTAGQGRGRRQGYSLGGGRPELLRGVQRLPTDQQECAYKGDCGDASPIADEPMRGVDRDGPAENPSEKAHQACEYSGWRQRPAIDRGALHKRPDRYQLLRCPFRIHKSTLRCKVKKSRDGLWGFGRGLQGKPIENSTQPLLRPPEVSPEKFLDADSNPPGSRQWKRRPNELEFLRDASVTKPPY